MRTIHKQVLGVVSFQAIEVPVDFKILLLAMQNDVPTLWYECTAGNPETREIEILCFGTGHELPDYATPDGAIEHIGSVVTSDGFYVWHYYRKIKIEKIKTE